MSAPSEAFVGQNVPGRNPNCDTTNRVVLRPAGAYSTTAQKDRAVRVFGVVPVRSSTLFKRLALGLLIAYAAVPAAVAAIGSAVVVVNTVTGKVKEAPTGVPLKVGVDVQQDESVETAANSATRLVFSDNTQFEVGPQSQVILDRFVFDPDPSKSQVALSLAKGTARFATGFLPKNDYEIHTPAATIGIRGTILNIDVASNKTTTVHVETGIAFVTGAGSTVQLTANQSTVVQLGGVPSPAMLGNPRPNQLQNIFQQALQSPDNTRDLAASILALYPFGGPGLSDLIAKTVEQNPALASAFIAASRNATTSQQLSLGAGLGQAAVYFTSTGQDTARQQLNAALVGAPNLVQATYAQFGVQGISTTALVTTGTGTPTVTTSSNTCVSPSQPNGGC